MMFVITSTELASNKNWLHRIINVFFIFSNRSKCVINPLYKLLTSVNLYFTNSCFHNSLHVKTHWPDIWWPWRPWDWSSSTYPSLWIMVIYPLPYWYCNILDNRPIESISFVEVIIEYLLLLLSQIRFLRNPKKTVPLIYSVKSEVLNIISSTEINDDMIQLLQQENMNLFKHKQIFIISSYVVLTKCQFIIILYY